MNGQVPIFFMKERAKRLVFYQASVCYFFFVRSLFSLESNFMTLRISGEGSGSSNGNWRVPAPFLYFDSSLIFFSIIGVMVGHEFELLSNSNSKSRAAPVLAPKGRRHAEGVPVWLRRSLPEIGCILSLVIVRDTVLASSTPATPIIGYSSKRNAAAF